MIWLWMYRTTIKMTLYLENGLFAGVGPGSKAILPAVTEQGLSTFKVDYIPPVSGEQLLLIFS
jgi:hypothetical protein